MDPIGTHTATNGALKARIGRPPDLCIALWHYPTPLHDSLSQACRAALATEQRQLKEQLFRAIEEDGQALR